MLVAPPDTPQKLDPPVRLAVLASGSGSNFAAIAEAADQFGFELVGVVCNNPGAYVLERAHRRGVTSRVVDHREFEGRGPFDSAVVRELRNLGAEWVAMAGWMRIASPVLLDAFHDRLLNIHPSLLPSFRGLDAVGQALRAGVRITGCTVHIVRPAVDDGPIVAQAAVPVHDGDDEESLHKRIHAAEHTLYPAAVAHAVHSSRR